MLPGLQGRVSGAKDGKPCQTFAVQFPDEAAAHKFQLTMDMADPEKVICNLLNVLDLQNCDGLTHLDATQTSSTYSTASTSASTATSLYFC